MTDRRKGPRPFAIDFHAHVMVPEVYAVAQANSVFARALLDAPTEEMKRLIATDPRVALAFRTIVDLPPEAIMKIAKRYQGGPKKK